MQRRSMEHHLHPDDFESEGGRSTIKGRVNAGFDPRYFT